MKSDAERFAMLTGGVTATGCVEWAGALERKGYGAFKLAGVKIGAHRAALILAGHILPDGCDVCHRCDNPRCVNVSHLFVGTRSDNMQDAKAKGRLVVPTYRYEGPVRPVRHGSRATYERHGCRCDECKQAKLADQKKYRNRKRNTRGKLVPIA